MSEHLPRGDPPEPRMVRRALWIAVGWTYVAALGALLVVGLSALVALLVELIRYLADYSDRSLELGAATRPALVAAWLAGAAAMAIAVWVAAFGSTRRGSLRSGVVAVVAAILAGAAAWLASSLALVVVVLGVGWAVAMPAEHPGRWLVRTLGLLGALALYPPWEGSSGVIAVAAVVSAPLVAGLAVLVGDAAWTVASRLHRRGADDVERSPTSLDV